MDKLTKQHLDSIKLLTNEHIGFIKFCEENLDEVLASLDKRNLPPNFLKTVKGYKRLKFKIIERTFIGGLGSFDSQEYFEITKQLAEELETCINNGEIQSAKIILKFVILHELFESYVHYFFVTNGGKARFKIPLPNSQYTKFSYPVDGLPTQTRDNKINQMVVAYFPELKIIKVIQDLKAKKFQISFNIIDK